MFLVSKGGSNLFLGYVLLWYQPQVLLQRELEVEQLAMIKAPTKMHYPYIDSYFKLMLSLNKASEMVSSAGRSWNWRIWLNPYLVTADGLQMG